MKRIGSILVLICFGVFGFAQEPVVQLKARVVNDVIGTHLSGAKIEVYKGDELFSSKTSGENGKFPLIDLPFGDDYTVLLSKEGFCTKRADFLLTTFIAEDLPLIYAQPFETGLFELPPGSDFTWMKEEPMIVFSVDTTTAMIKWDKPKLKEMQKALVQKKDELLNGKYDEYCAYLDSANVALEDSSRKDCYEWVKKAKDIWNSQTVTTQDMRCVNMEIKIQYLKVVAKADQLFSAKEYEDALSYYKRASSLDPADVYPKNKIKEIEAILKP